MHISTIYPISSIEDNINPFGIDSTNNVKRQLQIN